MYNAQFADVPVHLCQKSFHKERRWPYLKIPCLISACASKFKCKTIIKVRGGGTFIIEKASRSRGRVRQSATFVISQRLHNLILSNMADTVGKNLKRLDFRHVCNSLKRVFLFVLLS